MFGEVRKVRQLGRPALVTVVGLLMVLVITSVVPAAEADNPVAGTRQAEGIEARIVWIEMSANLKQFSSREGIAASLDRIASAGFNTVIIEAKNAWGFVNYKSRIAPHISQSPLSRETSPYEYSRYPAPNTGWFDPNFDQLQVVIEEAHKRGLQVHAAVNTFSEGLNQLKDNEFMRRLAPAYKNPEWQSVYWVGVRQVGAANGSAFDLSGTNVTRGTHQLILYTTHYYRNNPPNAAGVDVYVVDDRVVEIRDRAKAVFIDHQLDPGPIPVGEQGYVLSGHGTARQWIIENLHVGDHVDISAARGKFVRSSETGTFAFVNPHRNDVIEYELSILREIVSNYDIDGIVLDRARFNNISADFSPEARAAFEQYIGRPLSDAEWPTAIYGFRYSDETGFQRVEGPLYKQWLEFRAKTIRDFIKQAEQTVRAIKPDLVFSNYVGGWYPVYWNEGVNWGATSSAVSYDWMTANYHQRAGTAELYDYLMTGLYYTDVTIEETLAKGIEQWQSVEGGADLANRVIDDKTFHVGSLFLLQYQNDPERFRRALQMAVDRTHGVMLFDLVYIEMFDWWPIIKEEFKQPANAPYAIPGLLKWVRRN